MHEQISNDLIEVANKFPDLTVPISVGGRNRFKLSDINKILGV